MEHLKILSFNINGLNSPIKTSKSFNYLKKLNSDIICLQETHIKKSHEKLLDCKGLGRLYNASAEEKKRGVVVYIKTPHMQVIDQIKDSDGRFIFLKLKLLDNAIWTLVNIYAPNEGREKFFDQLFEKLSEFVEGNLIMLGDFNAVVNLKLDKSKKKAKGNKFPNSTLQQMEQLCLKDVWREKNSTNGGFTYYSDHHDSYSRIDQAWISKNMLSSVKDIGILPITISDHAPIELIFWQRRFGSRRWRTNNDILKDPNIMKLISEDLKFFFQDNNTSDVTEEITWDACKAFLRGRLISYTSMVKKKKRQRMEMILSELKYLELEHQKNHKKSLLNRIKDLRVQRDILETEKMKKQLDFLRLKTFEQADKPGRWLANKLRLESAKKTINKVQDQTGVHTDEKQIQQCFTSFYKDLYKDLTADEKSITEFLEDLSIRQFSEDQRTILNQKISILEVTEAIKKLNNGKAPGPDGLTPEIYKKFTNLLTIPLQRLMNNVIDSVESRLPASWENAYITLIPKDEQENPPPQAFRPISLLNLDYKIYAKILANRLEKCISDIIHEDQTCFMPGRYMKDNIRHMLNTIQKVKNSDTVAALIILDVEKAFDNVSWCFLQKVLHKVNCGPNFEKWIQNIYTRQNARLLVNGMVVNDGIKIEKGTRQGCPLSPLLFNIVLEMLATKIRSNSAIKGIKSSMGEEYKMRSYADDVVLTLIDPIRSIKSTFEILEQFGKVSGYKINAKKTKIFTFGTSEKMEKDIANMTACEVNPASCKYLGICIDKDLQNLFLNNYDKTWKLINQDLLKWTNMHFSWSARISIIKMNILPRLNFLFQSLPLDIKEKTLITWQTQINKFIWNYKRPRVSFKILQDDLKKGGLKIPNIRLYYHAAKLVWIMDWINKPFYKYLSLEKPKSKIGFHELLWSADGPKQKLEDRHWLRNSLLSTWRKFQLRISPDISPLKVPAERIYEITNVKPMKVMSYDDLTDVNGHYKSYENLENGGGKITWFTHLQWLTRLKHDLLNHDNKLRDKTEFEHIVKNAKPHVLSKIYLLLLKYDTEMEQTKHCMVKWMQNLGELIPFETWEFLWGQGLKYTKCQAIKEQWYKMFYRWYLTPSQLSKMSNNYDGKCWKGCQNVGTFYHMWWSCPVTLKYWERVHKVIQCIMNVKFELNAKYYLLGVIPQNISKAKKDFFFYATASARISLAAKWRQDSPPSTDEWLNRFKSYAVTSSLSKQLSGRENEEDQECWDILSRYSIV